MKIVIKKALQRHKGSTIDTGEGLTEQSHAQECDINYILKDYKRTGFIKHAKQHEGKYDDISVQDFQDAMFKVTEAQNMFNALPGQVKKDFGQSPAQFLEFVQNPENVSKLEKLGIIRGNDGVDMSGVPTTAPVIKETQTPVETPSGDSTAV